jgi:5-(carboxyamino)imidazole ribonucleotide synthase
MFFFEKIYNKTFGIIGGGQLGKMIAYSAKLLGLKVAVYANRDDSCAIGFSDKHTVGEYNDTNKIKDFAKLCDFITPEFEHIDKKCLYDIEGDTKKHSNAMSIEYSQNRLTEKTLAKSLGIKTPFFWSINSHKDAVDFYRKTGAFILKTNQFGYDGKGQHFISEISDLNKISFENCNFIGEALINFVLEFSVILTRSHDGEVVFFASPINIHTNGILSKSILSEQFNNEKNVQIARDYAKKIADSINHIGTMAVEFFITQDGNVVFNEIAPRPHNSGHYTLDMCNVSQFDNHVRAVVGLPLIKPEMISYGSMINLIDNDSFALVEKHICDPLSIIHLYGKNIVDINNINLRKIGHINILSNDVEN